MAKKILISVLSVILIMIIIIGGFRYFVKISADYMVPAGGITESDRKLAKERQPEYVFALEDYGAESGKQGSGMSALIGNFTNKPGIYFDIYDKEGIAVSHGEIGRDSENFKIFDIRNSADEIDVLCSEDGVYKLYKIAVPANGIARTSVKAELTAADYGSGISNMFLPDGKMQYIALTGESSLTLYDTEKREVKNKYSFESKSIISGVIYENGTLVLCGADSDDTETNKFSYGFAEAYSDGGELLWTAKLLNRRNCVSAAMECQILPNGNIGIYGRYFDYSESDIILSYLPPERYDELKLFGHGSDHYIYTGSMFLNIGENVQSSAFISEINMDGEIVETQVYSALNDFRVPSILQTGALNKLNSNGKFMLTIARAADEASSTYHLTIGDTSVEVPSDINVLYSEDQNGGIYVHMAESSENIYVMKYFTSAKDFAEGMAELRTAIRVSKAADNLPKAMMWFALLSASVIVIAAKNRWRKSV